MEKWNEIRQYTSGICYTVESTPFIKIYHDTLLHPIHLPFMQRYSQEKNTKGFKFIKSHPLLNTKTGKIILHLKWYK